jgi:hypothetical protein
MKTLEKIELSKNVLVKFGCSFREFGESLEKTVKSFKKAKPLFDELKKIKTK